MFSLREVGAEPKFITSRGANSHLIIFVLLVWMRLPLDPNYSHLLMYDIIDGFWLSGTHLGVFCDDWLIQRTVWTVPQLKLNLGEIG